MNTKVDEYILKKEKWQKELYLLRSVFSDLPLDETIKWGAPVYVFQGKNVVGLAAFKNYFGLWFFQGVLLKDKQKVFINAQEGKTKAMLQWRFYSLEEINTDFIKEYVLEAIENVKEGKLTTLTSSLKTYLFSIGKYTLLNQLKNKKRIAPTEAIYPEIEIADNQYFEQIELTHRQQIIEKSFQQLGEQCRELLTLFYYHRYSIENIKITMKYSNDNTVKATKSRCMKSLKTILEKTEIY